MSREHLAQSDPLPSQLLNQQADERDLGAQLIAGRYLGSPAAARFCGYRTLSGFKDRAQVAGVMPLRRGRRLLWDIHDLQKALTSHGPILTVRRVRVA